MPTITSLFGFLAVLASTALAHSGSNVAVYWGQGYAQIPLSEVCSDPSVDIVNLAFVNRFPKKIGDYPGTNFANACGSDTYTYPSGDHSELLSHCPSIGPGIDICHANGKKVLLSIGGGYPLDYYLPSVETAEYFAEFLWGAFGPPTPAWKADGKPRPFGDAYVDGFDLDLEAYMNPPPSEDYLYANYDAFVNKLKNDLYPTANGNFYISGAPQCEIPDARLADAISHSSFDFIFTQFYNTPKCSVRAGYNGLGDPSTTFTFDDWVAWLKAASVNPGVKLYMGMPASAGGALAEPSAYLTPSEANKLISYYASKHADIFGGVMLWEATLSSRNTICDKPYATHIKDILLGTYVDKVCPSASSSIASATSSALPTPTAVSLDGLCGPSNGFTCAGSIFGDCCSEYGFCGSSSAYCGVGCNPAFGLCSTASSSASSTPVIAASSTSSTPAATPTSISHNGLCGPSNGFSICTGSGFGDCCSEYGFCGSSSAYCGTGCNPLYGKCGGTTTSSMLSGSAASTFSSSWTASSMASSSILLSTGTSSMLSSSASTPYPTGNNATSTPYPTGTGFPISPSPTYLGTGSSSISFSSAFVPYPTTNNATSSPYPTGTSLPTTSSSYVGTGSSSSSTTSSSSSSSAAPPYPTSVNSTSTTDHGTGSITASLYSTGTTSCTDSSTYPITSSSSASSSSAPRSSTLPPILFTSSSVSSYSTPCSSTTSTATYPNVVSSGDSASTMPRQYPASTPVVGYPTGSPSGKQTYGGSSVTSPVTSVVTTTYVDICPTGFTTRTTTITKTSCSACTAGYPQSAGIPSGWTTTVAVCKHCGPQVTTVTLTKPMYTATATQTVVVVPHVPSASPKAGPTVIPSYKPAGPGSELRPSETNTKLTATTAPFSAGYSAAPTTAVSKGPGASTAVVAPSTFVQSYNLAVSSMKVPPPTVPSGNGTAPYVPAGTATKSVPKPTYSSVTQFQGAAAERQFGWTFVGVAVAVLFVL